MQNLGQSIQEWIKRSLWKTAFKKFEVMWCAKADYITSNFLKAVFNKFHLVHSGIHCPNYLRDHPYSAYSKFPVKETFITL